MFETICFGDMEAMIDVKGAELRSLKKSGKEYLWQRDPDIWDESAPWLFPIVCDAKHDELEIGGRVFPMPRHGFIRERVFQVVQRTETMVRLQYASDNSDGVYYPFPFSFSVVFSLGASGLSVSCSIENRSEKEMWYCVGWHPGFLCPMKATYSFEDYQLVFEKKETCLLPTLVDDIREIDRNKIHYRLDHQNTVPLNYGLFDEDALVFDHLTSRSVRLIDPLGKGIRVDFPDYGMLGVWTIRGKQAPYLCIEPWQGTCAYVDEENKMEAKAGVQRLLPRASRSYRTVVCIEE